MKIVFSDKIKKDILFTLTKVLPSVFIVYLIGMFIKNDYQLMSIETVLRMPSIIEFIFLFVLGCIGVILYCCCTIICGALYGYVSCYCYGNIFIYMAYISDLKSQILIIKIVFLIIKNKY